LSDAFYSEQNKYDDYNNENSCRVQLEPNKENFVVVFSTVESREILILGCGGLLVFFTATMATRHQFFGSWLVQNVCKCLNALERDLSLEEFFTRVQNQIHNDGHTKKGYGQSMEVKYFPHRAFKFKKY